MYIKNVYVPDIFDKYFVNKKITKIIKGHHSGDLVYRISNEYILKISNNIEGIKKEKEVNDFLSDKLPVSKSVEFIIEGEKAYYLKTLVKGKNLISNEYLDKPFLLIDLLVEALKIYHSVDISGCNIFNNESSGSTFIHGDFCLPNILVKNNKVSGFIDTQTSGIGDAWVDYAWCIWSLEYNLKTNKYTPLLLEKLGIEFDEEKYKKYINN